MLIFCWITSAIIVGVDQWVKWKITNNLALSQTKSLIPGVLSLNHIQNTGSAWSILEGEILFFILVTIIAIIIIVTLMIKNRHHYNRWFMYGLSLILAGAIGNFIDRIRLGYIVDMFQTDFMNFPIFNIADMSLTIGVFCILVYIILDEKDQKRK